jgi:4-alpha-glucanotransferase
MEVETRRAPVLDTRQSGILLHPTSLPGPHGIGDLGPAAYRFVDFLAASGQRLWQVLPLGPTGYGNSPYQSPSGQAGNAALVDLGALAAEGWLSEAELAPLTRLPTRRIAFGRLLPLKHQLLARAARAFFKGGSGEQRAAFEGFAGEAQGWLEDYATFMALKEAHGGAAWTEWSGTTPDPDRMAAHRFAQFQFFRQWDALRAYAGQRGIGIIGDLPLYVAHDSVEVWRSRELFELDPSGRPRVVAGVPPDYFSETGQLWGNPIYRWEAMERDGFRWWIERMRRTLRLVDVVRLDHFRGLEAYYQIPGGATDARQGHWVKGPGERLLGALRHGLGRLPFIAEDLGVITPEVRALRDRFDLAGMRILQFAFGNDDGADSFKPHNYVPHTVAYTGTHDNDTTRGWFRAESGSTRSAEQACREREFALRYLGSDGREIHWDFIRAVLASVARTAIVPLQDVMGLGSSARLNLPGSTEGNWEWRFTAPQLVPALSERLCGLARLYGRL